MRDSESMKMVVDGDKIRAENRLMIFTMTIGETYPPTRKVNNRSVCPLTVIGVAQPDPETPNAPRVNVRRSEGKSVDVKPIYVTSLVRNYAVPRVEKQAVLRSDTVANQISALRREVDALRDEVRALQAGR